MGIDQIQNADHLPSALSAYGKLMDKITKLTREADAEYHRFHPHDKDPYSRMSKRQKHSQCSREGIETHCQTSKQA